MAINLPELLAMAAAKLPHLTLRSKVNTLPISNRSEGNLNDIKGFTQTELS